MGPFARLRPGTVIEENARVGNFVEIKKSVVGKGSKVNHLTYIGDASIGQDVNIGAGTITCNYDGFTKAQTVIEDGVFVGSNANLVAPVRLGRGVIVAAGSTITQDVKAGSLVVARSREVVKDGWAKAFRAKHRGKSVMNERLKIFSGNANKELAEDICAQLHVPLGEAVVGRFSDGEIRAQVMQNVRGDDVFLVQPTCPPVNDHIMELLILTDALARASARRITVVIPYYGYGRQDRKSEPRVPISAKLVANLITAAGADRVLAMDLHVGQIQGFFDIPVDHLYAMPVFLEYIREKNLQDVVVVSPDAGGVDARALLPSGWTRIWPSLTSGARGPTSLTS